MAGGIDRRVSRWVFLVKARSMARSPGVAIVCCAGVGRGFQRRRHLDDLRRRVRPVRHARSSARAGDDASLSRAGVGDRAEVEAVLRGGALRWGRSTGVVALPPELEWWAIRRIVARSRPRPACAVLAVPAGAGVGVGEVCHHRDLTSCHRRSTFAARL